MAIHIINQQGMQITLEELGPDKTSRYSGMVAFKAVVSRDLDGLTEEFTVSVDAEQPQLIDCVANAAYMAFFKKTLG